MEYVFEIHYSTDGIEDLRAFLKGTFEDAVNYHTELVSRGNRNVRVIWRGGKA